MFTFYHTNEDIFKYFDNGQIQGILKYLIENGKEILRVPFKKL